MKTIAMMILVGTLAMNPAFAKVLNVALDLSGSNPLISNPNFATGAAAYVQAQVLALKPGDAVVLHTFGARNDPANLLTQRVVLTRRNRPQVVARALAAYIRNLPKDKAHEQSATNLIGWLELTSGFDCARHGQIVAITDGLESSSLVNAEKLLAGKVGLPKPEVNLSGCSLTFYGLGTGWPTQDVLRVRKAWRVWAKQAGADFTSITP